VARQKPGKTILRIVSGLLLRIDDGEAEAVGERRPAGAVVILVGGLGAAMQRDDQWRLRRQVFGSIREHTKVAGICTKPGQFSQPWRAGWRYAGASRLLSCRCKKTFEFASKRLETGKNLAWIAHQGTPYCSAQYIWCDAPSRALGMESRLFRRNPDAPR